MSDVFSVKLRTERAPMKKLGVLLCLFYIVCISLGCGGGDTVTVDETPEAEQSTPETDDMQAEAAGGAAN